MCNELPSSKALQQPHLLKTTSHSRQPSDGSVDRFTSKEDAADPGDHENKVRSSHGGMVQSLKQPCVVFFLKICGCVNR